MSDVLMIFNGFYKGISWDLLVCDGIFHGMYTIENFMFFNQYHPFSLNILQRNHGEGDETTYWFHACESMSSREGA